MATIVSTRILRLQAVSPRTAANTLPATIGLGSSNLISGTAAATVVANAAAGAAESGALTLAGLKLAKAGGDTLTGTLDITTTTYAGGLRVGDVAWNTTTGAVTGGSGVVTTKRGVVGASAGTVNFVLSAVDGSIFAQLGTIGGFDLGADYIRDVGNSFGMASTVTGGDDVRFWAGATFANRATAPFRLTEAGVLVATSGNFLAGEVYASGISVASAITTTSSSTAILDFSTTGRLIVRGPNSSTNAGFKILSTRGDGSNIITVLSFDAGGAMVLGANASIGTAMTCTTPGTFKASIGAGAYSSSAGAMHELVTDQPNYLLYATNTHATTPYGMVIFYAGATPNNAGSQFVQCYDNAGGSTLRFGIDSNGGKRGYPANDTNLCDARSKSVHEPFGDSDLDALEAAYVSVDWGRYKYADQTHDDWNYGYTAQGVQRAFALSVPSIVDVWNLTKRIRTAKGEEIVETTAEERRLCVYGNDLENIGQALLARALKRISVLENRQ